MIGTIFTNYRTPIIIGAVILLLFIGISIGIVRFWPKDLSPEDIARIEATCSGPKQAVIDELQNTVPPLATDGEAFVRGLEQLPFMVAALSQRSYAYEDAQTTPPSLLAQQAKDHALRRFDLSRDLVTCYQEQLRPQLAAQVASVLAELQREREQVAASDFSHFYATGEPAVAVVTIGAKEEKRIRLRTLCIDRFAPPPQAGAPYILGGTVDELKKPSLCELLRSAAAEGNVAGVQNAVWRTEQERMDAATAPVGAAAGATGIVAAQRERRLLVRAEATGTLTALDVTLTNTTDAPLTLDTSCAYFVPLSIPDLNQPLPSAPLDWSDPNTAEQFTADIERKTLQNLDEQEKLFEQLGTPFPPELKAQQESLRRKYGETRSTPAVKGVYSNVFIPGADTLDPDSLDRFQVVQTGLGLQPLGVVGVSRGTIARGRLEIARLRDILERTATDPIRSLENLERALDEFARNPSRENTQDLHDAVQSCVVNNCTTSTEVARIWEQISSRADRMVDQAVDRVIASTTAQTLQDAIDAMRFCQSVGCSVAADVDTLDAHLRGMLRDRAARKVPASAEE